MGHASPLSWRYLLLAPMLCGSVYAQNQPDKPATGAATGAAAKPGAQQVIPPDFLHHPPEFSDGVRVAPHDPTVFSPDPAYADKPYDAQAQWDIYGAKHANPTQRPLLEWGRELYQSGPFQRAPLLLGQTNPMQPQLLVYGDYRNAVAYNDNGAREQGTWAHRLNLEVDARLTATERIHAFFRPFDKNGSFQRYDFSGENEGFEGGLDGNVDALFFEGDLGYIMGGLTGREAQFDLPFAVGLIPLLFQNGVWVEDAFTGLAVSIPARNSALLDWSNFDITFFAGFDRVSSGAFPGAEHDAAIFGVTAFIEEGGAYWELGYGYTQDKDHEGRDYHNITASYTRRYFDWFSNSLRVIANTGQDPKAGKQTADGVLVLVENSLITSQPSTFIPYINFFAGFDHPQSLARDPGAGGVLKNTGILFETDGLTGFPTLDATAANTYGFAAGINLIGSNFENQLVVEFAMVQVHGDVADRFARDNEYGIGVRYQHPLTNALILRADAMYGWRDGDENLMGVRLELRYKF